MIQPNSIPDDDPIWDEITDKVMKKIKGEPVVIILARNRHIVDFVNNVLPLELISGNPILSHFMN